MVQEHKVSLQTYASTSQLTVASRSLHELLVSERNTNLPPAFTATHWNAHYMIQTAANAICMLLLWVEAELTTHAFWSGLQLSRAVISLYPGCLCIALEVPCQMPSKMSSSLTFYIQP